MTLDMTSTIVAKSDQMNSDDLFGRSITIKITKVSLLAGEQPVALNYEGDEGKPWKPCKSMRRVLVNIWGSDGNAYSGRSLTLYRDARVMFGGAEVGGIRISHMSNIAEPVTMSLTASKKSKKPFTVQPLTDKPSVPEKPVALTEDDLAVARGEAENGAVHLAAWWKALGPTMQKQYAGVKDELKKIAEEADKAKESADDLSEIPEAFKGVANA